MATSTYYLSNLLKSNIKHVRDFILKQKSLSCFALSPLIEIMESPHLDVYSLFNLIMNVQIRLNPQPHPPPPTVLK